MLLTQWVIAKGRILVLTLEVVSLQRNGQNYEKTGFFEKLWVGVTNSSLK